jgi:Galactose oxidase, central domain
VSEIHVLDTETFTWEAVGRGQAPADAVSDGALPSPRSRHSATLIGEHDIWIFGGGDDDQVFGDVWVLNALTFTWHRPDITGPAPSARWGHSVSVFNETSILVFGGHLGSQMTDEVWILDTEKLAWTQVETKAHDPSANQEEQSATAAARTDQPLESHVSGKLRHQRSQEQKDSEDAAAAGKQTTDGGTSAASTPGEQVSARFAHRNRSGRNAAQAGPQRPSPRAGHAAEVFGKRLVVFGGGDGSSMMNDTWFLDLETWTWNKPTISGGAPTARCAHTMLLIPGEVLRPASGAGDSRIALTTAHRLVEGESANPRKSKVSLAGSRLMVFGGDNGSRRFKVRAFFDLIAFVLLLLVLEPREFANSSPAPAGFVHARRLRCS